MKRDIYKSALDTEKDDPKKSLKLYSDLQKENQLFHWDIMLICIAGPICAYYLGIWIISHYNVNNVGIMVLLWVGVGLYPGFLLYEWRRRKGGFIRLNRFYDIGYLIIAPLTLYFGTVAHIIGISIVAAICAFLLFIIVGPIYYLLSGISFSFKTLFTLPPYLDVPIMSISLLYGFLLVMSDPVHRFEPLWPYLLNFKRMFIALRFRLKGTVSFIIAVAAIQAVYRLSLNDLFGEPKIGLASSFLGGLLFSLGYGFTERDVVKGHLLRLAMVRCELQIGRTERAGIRLLLAEKQGLDMYVRFVKIRSAYPKTIIPLIEALKEIVKYKKYNEEPVGIDIGEMLQEADDGIEGNDPNYEYYIDAIDKISEIISPASKLIISDADTLDKISNQISKKYSAIARVLTVRFFYPPGDNPSEYERWEYEYYKSGQQIDIEVIDGEVVLDKPYKKGDTIKSVWGCGKTEQGFIQIYDKLKAGDMVGYYTYRMSFGANIIAFERLKNYKCNN